MVLQAVKLKMQQGGVNNLAADLSQQSENLKKFETQVEDMHGILVNISSELVNIRVSIESPVAPGQQG